MDSGVADRSSGLESVGSKLSFGVFIQTVGGFRSSLGCLGFNIGFFRRGLQDPNSGYFGVTCFGGQLGVLRVWGSYFCSPEL